MMLTTPIGTMTIERARRDMVTASFCRFVCKDPSVCTAFQVPYVYNEGDVETNPGRLLLTML
jgi:hypothetical protein